MTVLAGAVLVRILAEKRYLIMQDGYCDLAAALVCLSLLRTAQRTGDAVDELDFYRRVLTRTTGSPARCLGCGGLVEPNPGWRFCFMSRFGFV